MTNAKKKITTCACAYVAYKLDGRLFYETIEISDNYELEYECQNRIYEELVKATEWLCDSHLPIVATLIDYFQIEHGPRKGKGKVISRYGELLRPNQDPLVLDAKEVKGVLISWHTLIDID